MSTHDDLRDIALNEFAVAGYAGTSLQRIAELAGVSKSTVLYHFASKEALLEAAIGPAIDRMDAILGSIEGSLLDEETRRSFIEQFVDFLLQYRLEVHMFINQGPGLEDVPVVDRANALVVTPRHLLFLDRRDGRGSPALRGCPRRRRLCPLGEAGAFARRGVTRRGQGRPRHHRERTARTRIHPHCQQHLGAVSWPPSCIDSEGSPSGTRGE
ncbi:MAG: helix-turn-helix domain-containing protein [Galbitalea sp.]